MDISQSDRKQFQKKILDRYASNKRDLPWRETTDPYKIMVSEIMLQQTQVPRVITKFNERMKNWPTVKDIASASRADVLRAWSGLGFNRRAVNLHEACKKIAHDLSANTIDLLMHDYAYLISLPGIGDYTANAILAFAYNMEVPVLDINIKRVLIHSFDLPHDISGYDLQILALSLVPIGSSRDRHNALMDYGSAVLDSKATGIQSAKQSKFTGSDREVRGRILKQLAAHSQLSLADTKKTRPDKDVAIIVAALQKENIISVVKGKISIAEG